MHDQAKPRCLDCFSNASIVSNEWWDSYQKYLTFENSRPIFFAKNKQPFFSSLSFQCPLVAKVPLFGLFCLFYSFLRDTTHFRTWITKRTLPNSGRGISSPKSILKIMFFAEHVCEFHLCVQWSCGREFVFLSWTFVQFCLKLED